jgi:16S rRNA (cytosine967-C5)-methyltransferase
LADPRLVAVEVVSAVLDGRALDQALAERSPRLAERDRALAAELSYGACRWYRRLDALIGRLLRRPLKARDRDLHLLLVIAAYQLLYSRVPAHAAVATAVDATRRLGKAWAGKLVNAVLRTLQREQQRLGAAVDAEPALRYAQPDWLYRAVVEAWPAQCEVIFDALQRRPPMTLRVDLRRIARAAYVDRLAAAGIAAHAHATVPSALTLAVPAPVHALPGFDSGLVSVQDAGAQIAGSLLDVHPGQRILDACAAPGGKTLDILQRADDVELVALDVDPQRLQRVADNLRRARLHAELHAADAAEPAGADWSRRPFDRILLDAPCSATGVMRRHPDIRLLRREGDIGPLAERQARMLDALWPLLAPGGRLVYATCSLLPVENRLQIDAFRSREPRALSLALPQRPGSEAGDGVQLLPGVDDTDGFYYAALEKPAA